ncbi:MAG: sugar phosphate isomerase/epimerase family protein [Pirellulaceae bacterium]
MTNTMQGPGIMLAQFLRDDEPFNNLESIGRWVASLGYKAIQVPSWDARVFDLDRAAESQDYCDDVRGRLQELGLEISELSAHLQGQVLAIHPAYEMAFQPFYPDGLKDQARAAWASGELEKAVIASHRLGLTSVPVLSGGFAWHMAYPWPQRPEGLIDESFRELYQRWKPILDLATDKGQVLTYELHPGSDLYDGATFERFLDISGNHPAACILYDPSHFLLQQLDYLQFIERYGDRIKAFHVKDAEFNPTGRVGVYGGYQSWAGRAGRFRSLGDGQIDFKRVFTLLAEQGYDGWAVLEWECCVKSPEQGAREGAPFIARHLIEKTEFAFDDFAGGHTDAERNRKILGLS